MANFVLSDISTKEDKFFNDYISGKFSKEYQKTNPPQLSTAAETEEVHNQALKSLYTFLTEWINCKGSFTKKTFNGVPLINKWNAYCYWKFDGFVKVPTKMQASAIIEGTIKPSEETLYKVQEDFKDAYYSNNFEFGFER